MDHTDKSFRVAAIQMSPVLMNRDGTTEKVVKTIEKCGQEGIRFAVFPETIIPGRIFSGWA